MKAGKKNYTPNMELLGAIQSKLNKGYKLSQIYKWSGVSIGYNRLYAVVRDNGGLSKEDERKLWEVVR